MSCISSHIIRMVLAQACTTGFQRYAPWVKCTDDNGNNAHHLVPASLQPLGLSRNPEYKARVFRISGLACQQRHAPLSLLAFPMDLRTSSVSILTTRHKPTMAKAIDDGVVMRCEWRIRQLNVGVLPTVSFVLSTPRNRSPTSSISIPWVP